MINFLISLPIGLIYFIAVLACGYYFSRHFSFLQSNILIHYGFALTCGLAVLGFIWNILAAIPNGMQTVTVCLSLSICIFLGRKDLPLILSDVKTALTNIKSIIWPDDKYLRWLIVPLSLYLLMALPLAFHPLGTDALAFYFAQAKLIAYAHHFVPLPIYESFAQIPLPAELGYTAIILIGSEWAARFITTFEFWACALLIAGCTYHLTNKNIRSTWLSIFLLLTSTAVTLLISDGKTDLYAAMLGFSACYISLMMPLNIRRNILLLGILVGFSFTAKLSYVPILVPMIGIIIFARLWIENDFKKAVIQSFSAGFVIALCILIAFIPNVAKNFMAYNEPLAPFMFFHNKTFTPFLNQSWFSPDITHYILSIYPIAWTFGQFPMQHGNLSPFIWAALPALFFIQWGKTSFVSLIDYKPLLLAGVGCVGMLAWAIFYPSVIAPRYVFPALFSLIPIAAIGLNKVWDRVSVNRMAHIAFVASMFCASFMVVANDLPSGLTAAKNIFQGPQKTLLHNIYVSAQTVEKEMPPEGRLFLAAWERSLLDPKIMSCLLNTDEQDQLKLIEDSSKYWETLYSLGTRIVLINVTARKDVVAVLDPEKKPEWLTIEPKKIDENYIMYAIIPTSDAPLPKWGCIETNKNYYQPLELSQRK